jgi:hypothetical protein
VVCLVAVGAVRVTVAVRATVCDRDNVSECERLCSLEQVGATATECCESERLGVILGVGGVWLQSQQQCEVPTVFVWSPATCLQGGLCRSFFGGKASVLSRLMMTGCCCCRASGLCER